MERYNSTLDLLFNSNYRQVGPDAMKRIMKKRLDADHDLVGRSIRGLNMLRSGLGTARSGLPSASKVKDFFTKSPQSSSTSLGNYKGPAPFGTDRFLGEKLRPMFQNTGAALKDVFGGAGKLKDYKSTIGIGGIGGGYGLKKMYEGFKDVSLQSRHNKTWKLCSLHGYISP